MLNLHVVKFYFITAIVTGTLLPFYGE